MTSEDREYFYTAQHLVTGEFRDVHVVRLRMYADSSLHVTSRPQDIIKQMEHPAEYHIDGITAVKQGAQGDE